MPRNIAPRITFHGLLPSPSLEVQIRDEVDALAQSFDRIARCRVSVELPHRHHRRGGLYRVVVEVDIPGHHVVAARSADQEAMHANARLAVRDAFRAARRQLDSMHSLAEQRRLRSARGETASRW
jgi:Sigma 54 modulation protein / S30EA ribosomal protein